MVVLVIILNSWSKKILTKQSLMCISQNEVEIRRRKRNRAAVAILNTISFIYAVCMLPLGVYYVLVGVLAWMNKEELLFSVFSVSTIMSLPLFPCSGLNALVYMLKNKKIRRFYKQCFSCKLEIHSLDPMDP